jgi:GT2 family glycosyltransferase
LSGRGTLDVVIVSYRCRELLRDCLRSLAEHPPERPMRVFVVDNASGDGSVEMVRHEFPGAWLHAADSNLGFSAATNRAVAEGDADYVLMLNPDTRVLAGALERVAGIMDARPEVGICGCRLERPDGTFDHAAKRSFPTPISALGHFLRIGRRPTARGRLAAYRAPHVESGPVDAVNGAFMLVRRRALEEVGGFDEGYWLYMEDLDLCYRFARAGWVTWYEPSATVIHVKGGSSGRYRPPRANLAFHHGMLRFYRMHYARERSVVVNAAVYAGIGLKLASALVRSGFGRHLRARL